MRLIAEGSAAPDFELPDQHDNRVRLSDVVRDGPVALFFYPAAMTPGCTKQACHFRDLAAEFSETGGQRYGISTDPPDRQRKFSEVHGFGYPLLSDESGEVAAAYGVRRRLIAPVKRATFVIDREMTVRTVISSEWDMDVHADEALAALRAL